MGQFDASVLSDGYVKKTSLARYNELRGAFPNALIFFEHGEHYYGFDETAVALYDLFGCRYSQQKGKLVVKVERSKFEEFMIARRQMRGFRYVVDRNGSLTFERGAKKFHLQKPLSYYEANLARIQNKGLTTSYWNDPITKHGGGWHDDVWVPGLPSTRLNGKKPRSG